MTSQGVNFQLPSRGQFSAAVDTTALDADAFQFVSQSVINHEVARRGAGPKWFSNSGPDLLAKPSAPTPAISSREAETPRRRTSRPSPERRPAYPRDAERLEPCTNLKRSVQLFPHVDLGRARIRL